DQDLAWLYPGSVIDSVIEHWRSLGPSLVCVTLGAKGAVVAAGDRLIHRPAPQVAVVDTVGAGDAFTAGLLSGLVRAGAATPAAIVALDADVLAGIVDEAVAVAAITCSRAGANSPTRTELTAYLRSGSSR
ncbi:MAG TPA: PfkB family carbohydrate kinase, partial [Micromonosporaceae bacterium]